MTVAQLFARIGLKADTAKAEEFSKSVKGIVGQLKAAALGSVAFGAAVVASMKGALDSAAAFRQFQAETGASTQMLQQWQAVASGANVSTEAIADSVKELAQNREKIKLGGGNMSGFAFLGINPMDDPFSILDQLRTKTMGLPQAMKANLLAQMGVSSQFLQILSLTNDQFAEMRSNAFTIPQSAFDSLNKTQGNLNTLGNAVKWLQALLAEKLAPVIDKVVTGTTKWIKANKDGLIDGVVKGTRFLVDLVGTVIRFIGTVNEIVSGTIGWKNALLAFLVVWGIMNAAFLASPITWIIGGIILLAMVLDDLNEAMKPNGKESVFGKLFKENPAMKKLFEGLFGILKDVGMALNAIFQGNFKGFDDAMGKLGIFGDAMKLIVDYCAWTFKLLQDILTLNFKDFMKDIIPQKLFDDVGKTFGDVMKAGRDAWNAGLEMVGMGDKGKAKVPEATRAALTAFNKESGPTKNAYSFTFSTLGPMTPAEQSQAKDWAKKMSSQVEANRRKAQ